MLWQQTHCVSQPHVPQPHTTRDAKFGGSPERDQRLALLDPLGESDDALGSVGPRAKLVDAAEGIVIQAAATSTSSQECDVALWRTRDKK